MDAAAAQAGDAAGGDTAPGHRAMIVDGDEGEGLVRAPWSRTPPTADTDVGEGRQGVVYRQADGALVKEERYPVPMPVAL